MLKKPNVLLSMYDLGFTNEYLTPACAGRKTISIFELKIFLNLVYS